MNPGIHSSPDTIRDKFKSLETVRDLAGLLEISEDYLTKFTIDIPWSRRYRAFRIKKRAGGYREIHSPTEGLKDIQRRLGYVFSCVYQPKATVHGFTTGRNIVSNSKLHVGQRYVLNLDLKDFFPSIHNVRVRGMLMAVPYGLNETIADYIAGICTYQFRLPQGAPTSPIISNMISAKMDSQLRRFSNKYKCIYTRYADDITISTSVPRFPEPVAELDGGVEVVLGAQLIEIINSNGFRINYKKVRLQTKNRRQEVTGIVVNKFPNVKRKYVRQIRAMLHAWRKFGYERAENEFIERYDTKHRSKLKISFKRVLKGKIDFLRMVRGEKDKLYIRYWNQLVALDPSIGEKIRELPLFQYIQGQIHPSGESREVEFKSLSHAKAPHKSIIDIADKESVAFLNSQGGSIFWGVRDDRIVEGVNLEYRFVDEIQRIVSEKMMQIEPRIDPSFYSLQFHPVYRDVNVIIDNSYVIELNIQEGLSSDTYFTGKNEAWVRADGATIKLDGQRLIKYSEMKKNKHRNDQAKK